MRTAHRPPHVVGTVGSNHVGMRQFNERIVLQAIRLHGALPKAELARVTRLSMQAVSVIINALLNDGLVIKQDRLRGRIGQPSVPIALNPDGAFTLGIKLGRRSLDVLALDFAGQVRCREIVEYDYPDPEIIFPAMRGKLALVESMLGDHASRIVGIGVAAPLWMGGWRDLISAPGQVLDAWSRIDIRERVQQMTRLPIEFAKDTTAACAAELVTGHGQRVHNFLYVYIGTFIGGGLVIDGRLHHGPNGNAGAIGSAPIDGATQLLHRASGLVLEQAIRQQGAPGRAAHDARALSSALRGVTDAWIADAARSLASTIATSAAVLDLDAIVIDGSLHRDLIAALIEATSRALETQRWEGIARPALLQGHAGADARAMGGAILPLYAHFAPSHQLFLKTAPAYT
ncbi:ROK family transcriptional regulator [Pararobbsia silviterrae]|uniref:ROK family transcriptional regulator n=1 Tax=Pararobbsia silviterrae TaxID=1792498 RepID=UPI003B83728A